MHFDEEMGFKFLGPGSTVFSPTNKRPPTVHVSIRLFFWLAIATRLNWAGRRWVRTLMKRTFGISQRCLPLAEPVSVYHVQAKPGAGPIFGTFFGR